MRHGIEVLHPRYPVIPKVGMSAAPLLLAAAARGAVAELVAGGFDFDLIDAHSGWTRSCSARSTTRRCAGGWGSPAASSREGIANVLLESMACGTPIVATPVWGTPEAVSVPAAGVLMAERTVPALVAAVETLFAAPPDREATRRHALTFSWDAACAEILEVMHRALARPRAAARQPRLAELPDASPSRS